MSFFEKICFCFCNKAGTVPLEEEGENQLETGIRRKDIFLYIAIYIDWQKDAVNSLKITNTIIDNYSCG